ncbi:MAG TPA: anti-sigma F factor [Candidatus Eisenbergiella merdavium]|uniref:Anti-sigma F factor n=1 Tax=Candidatus Eisenbergiella merdavium TaxID=2838551 RepID=A0A9D2NI39_9FIRM|nr:anti-sigma F factor [Candidatus Eisenbergiella merdavium]
MKNEMRMEFDAVSENEGFARVAVAAFVTPLDPTLEEVADIKTAVSEAVTNAVIHAYPDRPEGEAGKVELRCVVQGNEVHIEIEDHGIGIADVEKAMEPLFSTCPDKDRSGMGFAFMEAFMDDLDVESALGQGTVVRMAKRLGTLSLAEDGE